MAIRGYFLQTTEAAPPDGWQRGHVTLQLIHPDERVAVEAWRRGAFAVHPVEGDGHAVITHAPTGRGIWTARSMSEGATIVERIERLADWNALDDKQKPELRESVRKIIREIENATAWH